MKQTFPEIETRRLRLRPLTMDDLPALASAFADPDVMRYLPTGKPRTEEATRVELCNSVDHWQEHGFGLWAITLKDTGEFAGYCGIQYLHVEPEGVEAEALLNGTDVEVDCGLDKPYWGRGIAPEATRAALRYGFETVGIERIVAAFHRNNAASRHILESMGMREDETMHYYGDNVPHLVIYRDEFKVDDSFYRVHGA